MERGCLKSEMAFFNAKYPFVGYRLNGYLSQDMSKTPLVFYRFSVRF